MDQRPTTGPDTSRPKQQWAKPELTVLPKLTELTLVTGSPIAGEGDGGGGTVF
jgi:hypothetical protein